MKKKPEFHGSDLEKIEEYYRFQDIRWSFFRRGYGRWAASVGQTETQTDTLRQFLRYCFLL